MNTLWILQYTDLWHCLNHPAHPLHYHRRGLGYKVVLREFSSVKNFLNGKQYYKQIKRQIPNWEKYCLNAHNTSIHGQFCLIFRKNKLIQTGESKTKQINKLNMPNRTSAPHTKRSFTKKDSKHVNRQSILCITKEMQMEARIIFTSLI